MPSAPSLTEAMRAAARHCLAPRATAVAPVRRLCVARAGQLRVARAASDVRWQAPSSTARRCMHNGAAAVDASTAAIASSSAELPQPSTAAAPVASSDAEARAAELSRRFGGPKPGDTLVLALSGGVDSSLCASLLHRAAHGYGGSDAAVLQSLRPGKRKADKPHGAGPAPERVQALGFDLRVVYMRNWSTLDESAAMDAGSGGAAGCEWQREWADVQAVCAHLDAQARAAGIHDAPPLRPQLLDLSAEYWTGVFEPALDDWAQGRTPNPDVACNREVKFGALVRRLFEDPTADPYLAARAKEGKAWLVTGHYAGIGWERTSGEIPCRPRLLRCKDKTKDQTYYLSSVPESALRYAHFPLAAIRKADVKALAVAHGLPTAHRRESMGLCFVGERRAGPRTADGGANAKAKAPAVQLPTYDANASAAQKRAQHAQQLKASGFSEFIASYLPAASASGGSGGSGPLLCFESGVQLGTHAGLHTLTIGQNAPLPGMKRKHFVARKDPARNAMLVVQGRSHAALQGLSCRVAPGMFHWIAAEPPAQLRAGAPASRERGDPDGADKEAGEGNGHAEREREREMRAFTQIRHRQEPAACVVSFEPDGGLRVRFSTAAPHPGVPAPINGIAPGQVVALWTGPREGARCLGSGAIDDVETLWDV